MGLIQLLSGEERITNGMKLSAEGLNRRYDEFFHSDVGLRRRTLDKLLSNLSDADFENFVPGFFDHIFNNRSYDVFLLFDVLSDKSVLSNDDLNGILNSDSFYDVIVKSFRDLYVDVFVKTFGKDKNSTPETCFEYFSFGDDFEDLYGFVERYFSHFAGDEEFNFVSFVKKFLSDDKFKKAVVEGVSLGYFDTLKDRPKLLYNSSFFLFFLDNIFKHSDISEEDKKSFILDSYSSVIDKISSIDDTFTKLKESSLFSFYLYSAEVGMYSNKFVSEKVSKGLFLSEEYKNVVLEKNVKNIFHRFLTPEFSLSIDDAVLSGIYQSLGMLDLVLKGREEEFYRPIKPFIDLTIEKGYNLAFPIKNVSEDLTSYSPSIGSLFDYSFFDGYRSCCLDKEIPLNEVNQRTVNIVNKAMSSKSNHNNHDRFIISEVQNYLSLRFPKAS